MGRPGRGHRLGGEETVELLGIEELPLEDDLAYRAAALQGLLGDVRGGLVADDRVARPAPVLGAAKESVDVSCRVLAVADRDRDRALARHAHEACGGPGVGAIGMCFTGGFALGMMVDEVVLENPVVKGMPLFDIDRVEVLRGPQGTLFGRNTPAGVVKFDSKKPSQEQDGFALASQRRTAAAAEAAPSSRYWSQIDTSSMPHSTRSPGPAPSGLKWEK